MIFTSKLLRATAAILVASPFLPAVAIAQTKSNPTFEVASLRKDSPGGPPVYLSINPHRSGDRFTWTAPFGLLATYAYHLPWWRISGIETQPDSYTINATMDPATTDEQARLMLQALLVDRFKIVSHTETKELQGYALVVAKNGPKLKTANAAGDPPPMPDYRRATPVTFFAGRILTEAWQTGILAILARGVPISQLAEELSKDLKMAVVDQTGLTGKYYFGFTFQSLDQPSDDANAPSLFSALPDDVGLRLEKQKVPVQFLVVDHIEKEPSEN